eukprot:jgi/Orpsp1_1/1188829/evm.model.d7180000067517.1
MEKLELLTVTDLYSSQEKLSNDIQNLMNLLDFCDNRCEKTNEVDISSTLSPAEESYLESIIENKVDAIIDSAKSNINLKKSLYKLVDAFKVFDFEFNYTVEERKNSPQYLTIQTQTPPRSPVLSEDEKQVQADLDDDEMNEVIVLETINNHQNRGSLRIIDSNENQNEASPSKMKSEETLSNIRQIKKIQRKFKKLVKEQQKREKERLASIEKREMDDIEEKHEEKEEEKENEEINKNEVLQSIHESVEIKDDQQEMIQELQENDHSEEKEDNHQELKEKDHSEKKEENEEKEVSSSTSLLSRLTEALIGSKQKDNIKIDDNKVDSSNNHNNSNINNNDNNNENSINNNNSNNNNTDDNNKESNDNKPSVSKPIDILNRRYNKRRSKSDNNSLINKRDSFTNPMVLSPSMSQFSQSPSQGIYLGKSNTQQTVLSTKIQSIFSKQNTSTRDAECQTESYKVVIRGEDYNIPPGYLGHYAIVPLWTIWVIGYYYKKKTKPKSMWKFLALKTPGLLAKSRAQNKTIAKVERIN